MQQKDLELKEQEKISSAKALDEAEEQREVLKNDLLKVCETLQEVSTKSTRLAKKKKRFEIILAKNDLKQKRIYFSCFEIKTEQGTCV